MTVQQRLEQVFRSVFDDAALVLTEATTAADVPGWDSLEHITLMFALEEEFGLQFLGNELAEAPNLGALTRLIERRSARPLA